MPLSPDRVSIPAVLAALLVISCSESPTEPFTHRISRTAAIVVRDSLGTVAEGVAVRLVADFDSAGIAPVVLATTDAAGTVSVVLAEGGWGVHGLSSGSDPKVAGSTFTVPGLTRPETDTIVVRIILHAPSVARGRVLLGSETEHGGSVVGCPPAPSVVVTDSEGFFALDLLPIGHWTITMHHPGFRLGLANVEITTPGSGQFVPTVQLVPRSVSNRSKLARR